MLFDVSAKQYGDQVKFPIEIQDPMEPDNTELFKQARLEAKRQARLIFDYQGTGDDPTVSVKQAKDQVVQ
jgi:hypothetical protein